VTLNGWLINFRAEQNVSAVRVKCNELAVFSDVRGNTSKCIDGHSDGWEGGQLVWSEV
jgi:hypothetical protein